MRLFRRRPKCERVGHDWHPHMATMCRRCGYILPPPECWHCHQGTFCDVEPIMSTPCCDHCGRSVMDSPDNPDGTPSCLPSFDNAGSISLTDEQRERIMQRKEDE